MNSFHREQRRHIAQLIKNARQASELSVEGAIGVGELLRTKISSLAAWLQEERLSGSASRLFILLSKYYEWASRSVRDASVESRDYLASRGDYWELRGLTLGNGFAARQLGCADRPDENETGAIRQGSRSEAEEAVLMEYSPADSIPKALNLHDNTVASEFIAFEHVVSAIVNERRWGGAASVVQLPDATSFLSEPMGIFALPLLTDGAYHLELGTSELRLLSDNVTWPILNVEGLRVSGVESLAAVIDTYISQMEGAHSIWQTNQASQRSPLQKAVRSQINASTLWGYSDPPPKERELMESPLY